jgi:uncharacterized glyoxalase superfamily protein PhnB
MNTLNIFAAVISILVAMGISSVAGQNTKENTKMINRSTPILHVRSVEPAIKFWTEKFGFKVTIEVPEGDHIGFAALENGNVELMYQTYSGMKADPTNPLADSVEKGPSYIFMEVSDISKVIDSLKGGEIVQGLHETFYGSKEIVAREPGGHYVIFSQMPVR